MRDMVRVPGGTSTQRYQAPTMRMGRSQFDLSHNHKTTFDAGRLIPYFCTEVVPGDTHVVKLLSFLRIFSPLDAPIMDNISVDIDFFFVPNRLVWDNWEAFLGAHDAAGAQDTDYTIPILGSDTVADGDLASWFGLPIGLNTANEDISQLPFRAFRLIYNEWYRDQNLIGELTLDTGDANAAHGAFSAPPISAKKHDYFTSALPYLQKGDPVSVALASEEIYVQHGGSVGDFVEVMNGSTARRIDTNLSTADLGGVGTAGTNLLYVQLGDATGVSINDLREAAAIQRLLERDARGGTRHPELIRAHFGVTVPDYRTQRPEYLGGGSGYINVSPVANTSATATEDQGQLTGVGAGTLRGSYAKSFVEHGYVLGILRARGEISYSQGVDRMWSRQTKYDFLWPELAHLGEQAILNKELWIEGDATDDDVFGYQERYAEYRFKKSLVTGAFHPSHATSLDYWHLSEEFGSQPSLNQTFIQDATPMSRVTTVDSAPDFIIDGRFDFKCARALPVRPVPSLAPSRF